MRIQRQPRRLYPCVLGLILAALPASAPAVAQQEPLRFRHLTIADGLSQNAVRDILQDHRGFMWFATKDGVNRYDGYDVVVFRHDPFDSTTVSGNDITALYEDPAGQLWVGTRSGGLNRFDRRTRTFQRFPDGPVQPITALDGDEDGLWIGTDAGLYRYDPAVGFTAFRHDPARPGSLSSDRVNALSVDRRGELWIGTDRGLNRLEPGGARARSGVDSVAAFTRYAVAPDTAMGTIDATISALHEDQDGRLWIGSVPGVSVLSPDRQSIAHHYHRYREFRYGWGLVRGLLVDGSGRVWVATAAELMLLDPATGRFTAHRTDPMRPDGISSDQPTALFQDRSDVIWVGTNGFGINIHDPKATRFQTYRRPEPWESRLSRFSVYSLFEDSAGRVWIGAGVLYRWDRETGELISFETTSSRPDDFGNHGVWSMVEGPTGVLWVGSARGLYRYDTTTGRSRQYRFTADRPPDGLPEIEVRRVFLARDGTLWVVTENYLARLDDEAAGRFRSYRFTQRTTRGDWTFPVLHEDPDGTLWLGSHQGLIRFRPDAETFRHYRSGGDPEGLSHDDVRAIVPDPTRSDRYLWLATAGGGLNRFDRETGVFTHFTVEDGLPNNVVYGILPDDQGTLWLSTNRGLSRFDPRDQSVRSFDVADGLQSNEFNSGAYFRSPDGELFFGGLYGFNYFHPHQVHDNRHRPEVVITAFHRGNRHETVRDSGSVLSAAISEVERIAVKAQDNAVGFEFAALDYSAPEKNRYAYRLLGFDSDWVDAGTDRSATYTLLPPGSYTFQVRGSNNDGVWNEAGASLDLVVIPPWWRTPWAFGAYALLVLGLLWSMRRYELGRAELRNRLQLERIEAEKLRELDQAKSQFFADVSHEFRTPLTLTLGPLDDLLDGVHGPIDPDVRTQVGLARRSATRVLDLINQIMELARLEARRTPLKARPLDLAAFVDQAIASFRPLAERRTVRLEVALPRGPEPFHADPDQLEKVVANLLSNALKFTPKGGTVRVTAEGAGAEVRIAVRDSGPGIPEPDQAHVFDRFYRAERVSAPQSGTGIGLALVKEVVELHGGSIELESEEGFGSTFTVTLPRMPAGTAHPADGAVPSEEAPSTDDSE